MSTSAPSCARCGATITFEPGKDRAICGYCGAQSLLVGRGAGEVRASVVAGHPPAFFEAAIAAADPTQMRALCESYVAGAKAFIEAGETPDESLLRAIEETIDVTEDQKRDFRQEVLNVILALRLEGRTLEYDTFTKLHRALAAHLHLTAEPAAS